MTVWSSVTVNAAGTSTSGEGAVELRAPDGTVVALFNNAWEEGDARLAVEPPPLSTPEAATPTPYRRTRSLAQMGRSNSRPVALPELVAMTRDAPSLRRPALPI